MTIDALLEDAMKAPTELDDVDLVDDVRREIQRQPPKTARRVLLFATPLAAAACALGLFVLVGRQGGDPEMRAKGTAGGDEAGIDVYSTPPTGGALTPVSTGGVMHVDDALGFAVRGTAGLPWLVVYGVDDAKNVYWYHPAFTDAHTDPSSVPARVGPIPEVVRHDLKPGALHITALFTRAPLHVSDVERAVAAGARVPVEGDSATHTIDLQVQP